MTMVIGILVMCRDDTSNDHGDIDGGVVITVKGLNPGESMLCFE